MLDVLRASVSTIWTKILLTLLVIMFVVWGIGDVIRNPSGKLAVATVGDVTITNEEFARAMSREAQNLKDMMGDSFSPAVMKDPGLVHHVLFQLVNNALLRQESEALGLIPGDADIVRKIRTSPAFQDKEGNFDKTLFEGALKRSSTSETVYVNKLRQDMAVALLADTLAIRAPVPDIAARTLLAAREEQRNISLYELKPALIPDISTPDGTALKAYYDAHGHEFTAPEYRTASYVTISPANTTKEVKVSEDELQAVYKERQEEFKKPERREVEQLLYTSEDKANKASELLKAGKSFEQVGKETDILNKDALLLGKVERSKIMESAADKVFALQVGQVTQPIQSPFGWHIFRVTSIEPPSVSSFVEMRPLLEKEMAQHMSDESLNKLANSFQDALAGGSTLTEAAQQYGLKVITVGPIDHQSMTPENVKSTSIPELDKFLEVMFKTDEKTDSPMATSKGGIYYIMHVDKITPERLRTMDEVKGTLLTAWQKEERGKRLGEIAKDIGTKFTHEGERETIIAKYNLQPVKKGMVKRSSHVLGDIALPPKLLADIFSRKPQEGSNAYAAQNGEYLLATLDSVIPSPLPEGNTALTIVLQDISKKLEATEQNEILQQYVRYLGKKYPVSFNELALEAVLK